MSGWIGGAYIGAMCAVIVASLLNIRWTRQAARHNREVEQIYKAAAAARNRAADVRENG